MLTRTPVIIGFFIAMLIVGLSFGLVRNAVGGPLLDLIWTGAGAEARLAEMSAGERQAHVWGTLINDTLYPLAYGGFLAGLAGRFAGERWQGWVMLLPLATVLLDFSENTVQVLALSGAPDLLALKSILTPAKFGLLGLSTLLALGLALAALVRWLMRRGAEKA